jgi:hypothetical protein
MRRSKVVIHTRLILIGLLVSGCVPRTWPGDISASRKLAGRAEILRIEPLVIRVEGDLALRFRPEVSPHPDGPALLVARPCKGPVEIHSGKALGLWVPESACVAQIDQRPNGGRWLTMQDVLPLTRVYADPSADPNRVLKNLLDNASFAAAAMDGSLVACSEPKAGDLVCTIRWGDCLVMDETFYFRARPRRLGGTYLVVELGDFQQEGTEWWQADIVGDGSRPTKAL